MSFQIPITISDAIERVIGRVKSTGSINTISSGFETATYNENIANAIRILAILGDWAENSEEDRAKYLMEVNQRLSQEIIELKL